MILSGSGPVLLRNPIFLKFSRGGGGGGGGGGGRDPLSLDLHMAHLLLIQALRPFVGHRQTAQTKIRRLILNVLFNFE